MEWRPRRFGLGRASFRALLFTTLAALLVGFLPLFGGPGYESSLALGILLPVPVALATAASVCGAPGQAIGARLRRPLDALTANFCFALLVTAIQVVVLIIHGARVGFCDAGQGLLLFALGPASGVLLAAAWGTLVGLLGGHVERRSNRWVLLVAALGPIGGVLASVWRFWSSPMVFAFDPYVGFFAGTLYDTVIDAVPRLVTYRAGTLGTLVAVACFCAVTRRDGSGRLAWSRASRRPLPVSLGLLGAALSLSVYAYGPELGHYQTAATIREALGALVASERCDIVYASGIGVERAKLLATECDAHLAGHERYFEQPLPERVTVFAFMSAAQKGALMGASNTYIAKPWRREVYIQSDNYPHPVLGHELAHVVAGAFGQGPLLVAGPLGGWIPDPGRIEGFAVAAAPPEDAEFTLLEWTKALRELRLLPPLRSIFRLSFLGKNSATGYTVAGAVVSWLHDTYGPAKLRAWYAGASFDEAFGKPLDAVEQELSRALDGVELSARILELARARFDRPAIFGRRCPHVVDHLLESAGAAFERFDIESAISAYREGLDLDPANFNARMGLAACDQRRGADAEAMARYRALAEDPGLTRVQRSAAVERLADRALLAGDERASVLYVEAELHAFDEHRARTIAVKRYAADNADGRRAIIELLIGSPERGADFGAANAALGRWAERDPTNGLADYLIGKNLYSRARWQEAGEYLSRALERDLAIPSVRREALRSSVFVGCALGDARRASEAASEYLADPGLSLARKNGMERFRKVCRLSDAP